MDMKKVKEAEHKAFEDYVEDVAGAGALQLWIKNNPNSGYANERVNDYRSGWVACLEWLASLSQQEDGSAIPPAQDEREAIEVVGYTYAYESGAYSQYPGEDWLPLMTVAKHEHIVAAITRPAQKHIEDVKSEQPPIAWPHLADRATVGAKV